MILLPVILVGLLEISPVICTSRAVINDCCGGDRTFLLSVTETYSIKLANRQINRSARAPSSTLNNSTDRNLLIFSYIFFYLFIYLFSTNISTCSSLALVDELV